MKGIARENYVLELLMLLNYAVLTHAGSIVSLQCWTDTLNRAKISEVFFPIILNYWLRGGHNMWLMFSL